MIISASLLAGAILIGSIALVIWLEVGSKDDNEEDDDDKKTGNRVLDVSSSVHLLEIHANQANKNIIDV